MEIKYKVISKNTIGQTNFAVRFFTDIVTEDRLCNVRGPNNEILQTRTDYLVQMPIAPMTPDDLDKYIESHCPYQWFVDEEKRILAEDTNNTIDDDLQSSVSLVNSLVVDEIKTIAFPNPPKTNADWVAIKTRQIKSKRDLLISSGGFPVTIGGQIYWFHSDGVSTSQQLGLIIGAISAKLQGASDSTVLHPIPWKTLGGATVLLTVGVAMSLLPASFAQQGALFQSAENHIIALQNSSSPKTYDFGAGWAATWSA